MKTKRTLCLFLTILLSAALFLFPVSADNGVNNALLSIPKAASDGKISTRVKIDTVLNITKTDAEYLYIIFWDKPVDFTVLNESGSIEFEGKYLHRLIELPENIVGGDFAVTFKEAANISEIGAYTKGNLPKDVQNWQDNNTLCDLLLISTHADDEQLFFSGTLPLYAADNKTQVQVAYFTDHTNNIARRHELLNGLWTVGVRRYPVISPFPDAYSESYEGALSNLKSAGFTENDALAFQVELIRRFKPLVILGHDLKGEYGHGQHILNSTLLTKAVELANDETQFPDSYNLYGAYDTPKTYLHLYNENKITLDLDTPKEYLDGRTPFETSKEGFACHTSQQGTWFKRWLNGKNGEIKKAEQIKTYSPCEFGLFRSTVGEDILKNDLFENLTIRSLIPDPEPEPPADAEQEENKSTENAEKPRYKAPLSIIVIAFILISSIIRIVIKRKKP